jgi:uncharacterized surface protein with fasciclin (FAS1) repeats
MKRRPPFMPQSVAAKPNKTNKHTQMKYTTTYRHSAKQFTLAALLAVSGFFGTATAAEKSDGSDIVAVAEGAGQFTTLCAAVKAAGLVETLQSKGPFTVFAPNDKAFAKLPKGTLEDLLKPENKKKLADILTYHVLAGKVMAADVKTMEAETVNGQKLSLVVEDGKVTVDKAKVVSTDVAASNGVIHAIDTVLMPK